MPLKAIINGETITGPDLTEEEWTDLKERHRKGLSVKMDCCGAPGHLRISKRGIQHFYHASDAGCNCEHESPEHLEIKDRIYRICKSEGWETRVEFPAPDRTWISDVYASRNGRNIVFEIQVSTISPDDLEDRDRKYRSEGIESYWLLDNFLGRARDFASWYASWLCEEDARPGEPVPYLDPQVFATGPENHIFIPKGIRSAGLHTEKRALFTTGNPEISLADWVREVLKGNYRNYLEETATAFDRKRRLKNMAAPALFRFREFYGNIIRDETYRKKADSLNRRFRTAATARNGKSLQKTFDGIYTEIDWLEKEYRSVVAESSGLFTWKKMPGHDTLRPFFRLESESKIRKLQGCITIFSRWETSFNTAMDNLERDFSPG